MGFSMNPITPANACYGNVGKVERFILSGLIVRLRKKSRELVHGVPKGVILVVIAVVTVGSPLRLEALLRAGSGFWRAKKMGADRAPPFILNGAPGEINLGNGN